jgi:alpha-mannosidase
MQFHLIGNSHLDPVWLWDWREGLNEGLITVRTILDLMDEDPEVTYIRGESLIYRHIEETDPATFRRIAAQVKKGRWDVVGGTYIQPDTNLAGIETLARQYTKGQRYFQERFGRRATVAWQADSFGHTAGLPEVLRAAGIDSFAFTRPDSKVFPLREPAFWWEGPGGARILAYRPMVGWYGSEHDEVPRRLDGLLEAARNSSLQTVGCFYGLGNHGGGPSRRQLADIRAWAAGHPEVELVHSGLHRFFAALRKEVAAKPTRTLPVHRGELNFCLRGCYSSMARFKGLYRRGENLLARAERTDAVIAGSLGTAPADLDEAWRSVLFNSFHDILPGSSIERAMDDQVAWMGGVVQTTQATELRALNQLALQVDTRVADHPADHPSAVAALAWNPHPVPFRGHIELEACLDYRPLFPYKGRGGKVPIRVLGPDGKPLPFQEIDVENRTSVEVPWRKRVLVPVTLPSFGWNVLELGWVEGSTIPPVPNPVRSGPDWIDNGEYRVKAVPGGKGISISHRGRSLFKGDGLTAAVFEDPWGSWGGMKEEPESFLLHDLREAWAIKTVSLLEQGPERATLWTRLEGKRSRIDLTFSVSRNRPAVDVQARVFWADRSARLKLVFPVGDEAEFEVPGATVRRKPCGEVPGGRWVSIPGKFGFASDALYNFDCVKGQLRATVVRGAPYATEFPLPAKESMRLPTGDLGEFKFRFLLTAATAELPRLARELEQPPMVQIVPVKKGPLPRQGSLGELKPASLQLLALKPAEKGRGFVLRAQAPAGRTVRASFKWTGSKGDTKGALIDLGHITGGRIGSWLLEPSAGGWKAVEVDLAENRPDQKSASQAKNGRK